MSTIIGLNDHKPDRTGQDRRKIILVSHESEAGPGADEPESDRHEYYKEQWIFYGAPCQKIRRGEKQAPGHTAKLSLQRYVLVDHECPLQWQHEDEEQETQPLGNTPGEPAVTEGHTNDKGNICGGLG